MRFSVFSIGTGASGATVVLFLSKDGLSLVFETDILTLVQRSNVFYQIVALWGFKKVSRAVFPKQVLRIVYVDTAII